ncbi:hypothetical protein TruAng_000583 [Truncatella angustata]|nr:hypothetical protein TruAng_000583 [Truncatella angustata]
MLPVELRQMIYAQSFPRRILRLKVVLRDGHEDVLINAFGPPPIATASKEAWHYCNLHYQKIIFPSVNLSADPHYPIRLKMSNGKGTWFYPEVDVFYLDVGNCTKTRTRYTIELGPRTYNQDRSISDDRVAPNFSDFMRALQPFTKICRTVVLNDWNNRNILSHLFLATTRRHFPVLETIHLVTCKCTYLSDMVRLAARGTLQAFGGEIGMVPLLQPLWARSIKNAYCELPDGRCYQGNMEDWISELKERWYSDPDGSISTGWGLMVALTQGAQGSVGTMVWGMAQHFMETQFCTLENGDRLYRKWFAYMISTPSDSPEVLGFTAEAPKIDPVALFHDVL